VKLLLVTAGVLAALALGVTACGGDDDGGGDNGSATTEATSDGGESYDITAEEFIVALEDEKMAILEDFAADNPECEGAIDEGFLLDISARATNLPPDAPIAPEILDACTPETN
jgi:hypothetical protein